MADSSLAEVPGAPDLSGLEQLKNEKSEALFDTIDRLREFKVGQLVHLPQIIVVGNQSSGKSSVLRAISRAPFPTAGGVCTRFATELRLRRSPIEEASVSIRWNDSSSPFRRTGINLNDLPSIINEAKERMGIRKGGKKDYSKDILQIQISRPDACELTLVDLPGFFSQSTEDQNVEGATLVNELVDEYMKQSNSIILAVMSANQTLATQGILERAKPFDPKKERTLGVITKPDLAVPGSSDEGHFIKAARNEEAANKLALGWHVLRNTGETEGDVGPQERDDIEERFFQSGAWSRVPKRDRGVVELRKKLSNILLEHIQKTLPNLVMEIETSLYSRQEALDRLGAARAGPKDYRSYLIRLSTQFQSLAADAVDGNYGDEFFGDLYSDHGPSAGATPDGARKLRAMIRNLSRTFDLVLSTKGAKNTVIWDDATDEEEDSTSGPDDTAKVPDYLQNILALYDTFEESEPIAEGELNDRLRILASETQGKELPGAPNSALVVKLFQEQSQPWRAIAWRHITLCMDVCKSFVEQLFSHVIGDDATTMDSILRTVVDPFFAAKEKDLRAKLDELIRPYTKGYYALLEAEFLDRLSDRTSRRLADRLHMALSGKANPSRDDIQRALKGDSDDETNEFGTDKVIDMMLAYYQVGAVINSPRQHGGS